MSLKPSISACLLICLLTINHALSAAPTAPAKVKDIDTASLQKLIEQNPDAVLIDVRTQNEIEFLGGMIDAPNSFNIPRGWLEFRVEETVPDKNTPIVVYCGINLRSPPAARTLMEMGYSNVRNYPEGALYWKEQGLPLDIPDKARQSILYSLPEKVADGVWSSIGATAPPTYANSGHNNNLSFVVTSEGVLVVNAGDNYLLARALHDEIKKITSQPVRYVVLENGQGHAMLGSNYWQEQGATIIAHQDAAQVIEKYGDAVLERMQNGRRDKATGTQLAMPDKTFSDQMTIEMGGENIELLYLGPAHSPGDISVWLPGKKLVIAGDIAFHQRMLPVFEHTDTAAWIETWDKFVALGAETVIPGHGSPTTMDVVTRYTRDYLVYMREKISQIIDDGGDLQQAYLVDQSAYAHLDTFHELSRINAGRIFRAMEFE